MKSVRKLAFAGLCAGLFAGGALVLNHSIFAQEAEEAQNQQSGQGLEISPPLIELEADPGDSVVTEIHVRNITEIDVIARGSVEDFVAADETGRPEILLDTDEESPYPLAEYITDVPDLTIAPTEQETTQITINVPEDASPGGHFGVVRFSAEPADPTGEASAVSLSASIGTLILLNVSGDVEEDLAVQELAVSHDGESGGFFEEGPFSFMTRLNNRGNVYLQPTGELKISNLFGTEVGSTSFNENESNILPGSIRRWDQEFHEKDFWFGRYTLTADLEYGQDGTSLQGETNFWVIPWKIVAIVLLMLIAIGFFGHRALRSYKRSVVRKYQQQSASSDHNQHPPQQQI